MGNSSSNKEEEATMAQTYNQAPLAVGSRGPVSAEEVKMVAEKLAKLVEAHQLKLPERAFMEEARWRFGAKPDYTLADYAWAVGKKANHVDGSLDTVVENLVKSWEMERSHKLDVEAHQSIAPGFKISANGGKVYTSDEAQEVGNYNVLLDGSKTWEPVSWEKSHDLFHDAFAAFPWEVLKVFSGPPLVAFAWRHWGKFSPLYGFAVAQVNNDLKLEDVKVYYDADTFLDALRGTATSTATALVGDKKPWLETKTNKCPFAAIFG
ncbi:hypothetical protein CTAYLR_003820 [Chrysophaeum taylorii]|uniref:Pathogen-related protein n=1 Tax=Chrysophaeum taylorii TaxID=2483200 RepID=A0AAD7XP86_9STRA|nr:hypothetical protein CTAYLR_003820 [Chrysophaeum taylorii]